MIQLLVIGPLDEQAARDMSSSAWEGFQIEHENLPTAGMRAYKSMTPDVVILTYADQERSIKLAETIRDEPMGQFVELFVKVDEETESQNQSFRCFTEPNNMGELKSSVLEVLGISSPDPKPSADPTQELPVIDTTNELANDQPLETEADSPDLNLDRIEDRVTEGEIQSKYQSVQKENYFRVLEVSPDKTTRTDARQMYEILSDRYNPKNIDPRLVKDYSEQLQAIRETLEDAWAVLGERELRESYVSEIDLSTEN